MLSTARIAASDVVKLTRGNGGNYGERFFISSWGCSQRPFLRCHRHRHGHHGRLGRQGADAEGTQDAGARSRPRCEARRLSDCDQGHLGISLRWPRHRRRAEATGYRRAQRLRDHASVEALVRRRHRASVHGDPALRLDPRLSRRRPLHHVGPAELSLEPDGLRSEREGWRRGRLAGALRRDRAVVRPRRELHRRERSCREPAAAAGRQVPAADGAQLRRDSSAADDGREVQAQDDDRPRRAPHCAARAQSAAGHVPVPQPLHSRLPVRRVLQQQFEHAACRRSDGQHDVATEFDRVRADLRRQQAARDGCARARRADQRAPGVHCQGDLPVRFHVRLDAPHAELGVEALPERLRQRQRRARLQHHGSPSRRRRGRAGLRLPGSVLHRPPAQRLLHSALSQPRRREARVHPRLRLPGRRVATRLDAPDARPDRSAPS